MRYLVHCTVVLTKKRCVSWKKLLHQICRYNSLLSMLKMRVVVFLDSAIAYISPTIRVRQLLNNVWNR